MNHVPEYDEIHVISDLHIGGISGSQVFDAAPQLAALIRHLRELDGKRRAALVINGDMVDFLAEPDARYFEPHQAVAKLDRIFDHEPAFQPVWAELQAFVRTPSRHLVIVLGNHDLELALPWVRESLLYRLAGTDDAARGRIRLEMDGAGFRCAVGGQAVLCLHGNEVDTWNVTDFEMLRRIGRDAVQGRRVANWTPNAGTQLVIDVMNDIKKAHAFVDLLKPEAQAVIPILLALDEGRWPQIRRVLSVASQLSWDKVRRATGFLSDAEGTAAYWPRQTGGIEMLKDAERQLKCETNPISLAREGDLGFGEAMRAFAGGKSRDEVLLAALQGLEKDRSFDLRSRDATCEQVDRLVSNDFHWVITGHTHLERWVPRVEGGGTYINTGSWIPLIRLPAEKLANTETFRPIFRTLESSRTVEALSRTEGLVLRRRPVASIERDGSSVYGRLRRVELNDNGELQFEPIS